MIAYKLLKKRKNGSIGPLFINAKAVLPTGVWLEAEFHPRKGFAPRKGWHCTHAPIAPHLPMQTVSQTREWWKVEIEDFTPYKRPESQGGKWYLANRMKLIKPL